MMLLFDIDGTLLNVRGAGWASFRRGLAVAFGIDDDLHDVHFGGATDLGVLNQLRARLPIPTDDESLRRFFLAMNEALIEGVGAQPATACVGVAKTLDDLQQQGFSLGIVTGNARSTAKTKLLSAGIDPQRFSCGGYGDEHADRNELAALAVKRCSMEALALVGDTPRDVMAAKHIGAVAIGVTTGSCGRQMLVDAGADVVGDSLSEAFQLADLLNRR